MIKTKKKEYIPVWVSTIHNDVIHGQAIRQHLDGACSVMKDLSQCLKIHNDEEKSPQRGNTTNL